MADIHYKQRVAVVTGAGSGIGKAYALELAKRGASVIVNDLGCDTAGNGHDEASADTVATAIKELGGTAIAHYGDIATSAGGQSLIDLAVNSCGRIDILVNNAGITRDKTLLKIEEADWDRVVDIHLKGAFNTTKPALKVMKENNYGRMVFTTSGVGLYGNFGQTNYAAAKLGLVGFLQTLGLETMKYNIKCNAIAPLAATRMTADLFPPNLAALLQPEPVAALGLYLLSEQNSATGGIYNAAGGWYSRSEIICYEGAVIGDGKEAITPEDIQAHWDDINGRKNGKRLNNLHESFQYIAPLLK